MIDFEKLKDLEMEVINRRHTPEEDKAFSEFLKTRREKEDIGKKARPLPSMRKNVRAAAK
jgi:hypothetical protein